MLFNCATGLKYPLPPVHRTLDRSKPIVIRFNGREVPAFEGDTAASALVASGIPFDEVVPPKWQRAKSSNMKASSLRKT